MTKDELLKELLHKPLEFNDSMLYELIKAGLSFPDIRECIKKVYDLTESQLEETSNANTGMAGRLNSLSNRRRQKIFYKRIAGQNQETASNFIYAEGDSWFQFPLFITDILDWLGRKEGNILFSEASGGDWLTNIIYEEQYIPALSVIRPSFFLISGGGNDLVGGNRLAMMTRKNYNQPKYKSIDDLNDPVLTSDQKRMILEAQDHITKEFYAFNLIMKAQYTLLFSKLYAENSTQRNLVSITQGYDYAIPDNRIHFSLRYPFQPLVNKMLKTGQWLWRPLMLRGFFDDSLRRSIITALIYEFNLMFISMANDFGFNKLYHIDCRGLAVEDSDWYDELHYKSHVYRKVAEAYDFVMKNHNKSIPHVIRVADLQNIKVKNGAG